MSEKVVELNNGGLSALVYNGQLVSLVHDKDKAEYFYGGGKPANSRTKRDNWGKNYSEFVAFPVFGPVNDFRVLVRGGEFPMDQHGIARLIPFEVEKQVRDGVSLVQRFNGGSMLENPRYHLSRGEPKYLKWPFSYSIKKEVCLRNDGKVAVDFTLENRTSDSMPFMFGWHPGFRIWGDAEDCIVGTGNAAYGLDDIVRAPKGVVKFEGTDFLIYGNKKTSRAVNVATHGFGNFVVCCKGEHTGMLFIEPVTDLPASHHNYFLPLGQFSSVRGNETRNFGVTLELLG